MCIKAIDRLGNSCVPALSVLLMLVSRNVFPVVSALQSFAFLNWVSVEINAHLPGHFVRMVTNEPGGI